MQMYFSHHLYGTQIIEHLEIIFDSTETRWFMKLLFNSPLHLMFFNSYCLQSIFTPYVPL